MRDVASVGWRRATVYPVVGVALAMGSPLGLLASRATAAGELSSRWLVDELVAFALTYAYLLVSTTLVFAVLGRVLGVQADRLRAMSSIDDLTGLVNRRHMEGRIAEELRRARRYGAPLALMLVDVDRLKRINDDGGHDAGDAALRAVAAALRGTCRSTDTPARWGGDEYVVLATETRATEACEIAHRVADRLRTEVDRSGRPISVSVGIADLEALGDGGDELHVLYNAADRALYEAKRQGRDRAVVYTEQLGPPTDPPPPIMAQPPSV